MGALLHLGSNILSLLSSFYPISSPCRLCEPSLMVCLKGVKDMRALQSAYMKPVGFGCFVGESPWMMKAERAHARSWGAVFVQKDIEDILAVAGRDALPRDFVTRS
ncbi:hypothetical protein J3458_016484 [Metarhizium acridum]|uniref:uncharacterized protein n=1 Tax=Metarhizium acridum TaxID=92637 RepID=UPI001C6AFB0C|nr:hypothetical protein J3458_016484 [Metarhizium acridum]